MGIGIRDFLVVSGPNDADATLARTQLDWSYQHGQELYGSLVGHIVYGLIVGVIYATADRLWVALFVESDPINRQPEPLGSTHGPIHRLGCGRRAVRWPGVLADHHPCHRPLAVSRTCRRNIAGCRCDCSSVHQRTDWYQLWTAI
jgi:hypothetical protein